MALGFPKEVSSCVLPDSSTIPGYCEFSSEFKQEVANSKVPRDWQLPQMNEAKVAGGEVGLDLCS